MISTETIHAMQARPEDFRVLERVPVTRAGKVSGRLAPDVGDEIEMVVLDTETTGLEPDQCQIIELGMVRVSYSPSAKRVSAILRVFNQFEQPSGPIPELITTITGITDEMVAGKRIDDAGVAEFLSGAAMVVAHNAAFDRPFFENRFPSLANFAWACTQSLDWRGLGFESSKLEYLLLRNGYFYEGHRASIDCLATVWLLHVQQPAFDALLHQVSSQTVIVRAFGAPYGVKDDLKARGYRWSDGTATANKHWHTEIPREALPAEQEALDVLYRNASTVAGYTYLDASVRFKKC